MKIYIRAADIQSIKDGIGKGLKDSVVEQIIRADPTSDYDNNRSGKYWRWLFTQYKSGNLTEDDFQNVYDALQDFNRRGNRYTHTDIAQFDTVEEFLEDARRVGEAPMTEKEKKKMLKKQAHHADSEDRKFIAEDGDWEVWQPLTYAGSISLAREGGDKAKWCTAYEGNDNYWRSYTSRGPLYIFLNKSNPHEKYQLHFESNSWYDIHDHSQGLDSFYAFIADKPEIQEGLELYVVGGAVIKSGKLISIVKNSNNIDLSNIPVPVTEIGSDLFRGATNIKSVILPNTLTKIGDQCFSGCTGLETIELPNSLQTIGAEAFNGCRSLKSIVIPDSVTSIGLNCFCFCAGLESVKLSNSLESIGINAFNCCIRLTNIDFGTSLRSIGAQAFINCRSLVSVKLPASLQEIGNRAFLACLSLKDVKLPATLKTIGKGPFKNCPALSAASKKNIEAVGQKLGTNPLEG